MQLEKSHSTSKRETRLTRYEKLPRIGSSHEYIPRPPQSTHSISNPRHKFVNKQYQQPILIAIKLNDGRRLEKEFSSNNTIKDIITFIQSQKILVDQEFYLSSGDVPKRQFKDFNLTLSQANILTRTMEIEKDSSPQFYRQLLNSAKIFLTELDERSQSSLSDHSEYQKTFVSSSLASDSNINTQLKNTRQQCHQRLLTCSRKKLRLLALQEQNDRRHATFQKFIDNLDEKRSANIRRYQLELRDYLLRRLEADRLRQELHLLNIKIEQLNEEKEQYSHVMDIVRKAIPLFLPGSLQGGADGVTSLISRYETLVQTKNSFEQRDFSKEKQERRQESQRVVLQHNIRIAQLNTRIAQLHSYLNTLQKSDSRGEELFLSQLDYERLITMVKSQLENSIHSIYDRYRLVNYSKSQQDPTTIQKLRSIQDFILYQIDLVQKAKQ